MKLFRLSAILLAVCMLFTGCDAVRSMLGKPTSKDLEQLRLEQEAARAKAREDSIAALQAEVERIAAEASRSLPMPSTTKPTSKSRGTTSSPSGSRPATTCC